LIREFGFVVEGSELDGSVLIASPGNACIEVTHHVWKYFSVESWDVSDSVVSASPELLEFIIRVLYPRTVNVLVCGFRPRRVKKVIQPAGFYDETQQLKREELGGSE